MMVMIMNMCSHIFRNSMMYVFGLKPSEFDNTDAVNRKLSEIKQDFDLIMVNDKDYFNKSLILLKEKLGLSYEDIAVLAVNKQVCSFLSVS